MAIARFDFILAEVAVLLRFFFPGVPIQANLAGWLSSCHSPLGLNFLTIVVACDVTDQWHHGLAPPWIRKAH
jgi:hypothetical protein